jgi:acyl-CoA thioesterase FadM
MQSAHLTPWIETAPFEVRYAETDAMGVVYYANYLVWFEAARGTFCRAYDIDYVALEANGTPQQWWRRTVATARLLATATR